jgi:hypothetical protein
MAELFTSTIPNLIQGVSQQPDAQRDPTQAELQINGVSSSAEGLRKRDPTQTLARVSATSLGDVFVHAILRDRAERYLAVISNSTVKVFDLDGVAQTVSAPNGYGYLSGVTDAKRQIRCGTVADYTFVASSLKVVAMDAAVAPAVARPATNEALVWVKAANYSQSYRVNVNGTLATVTTTATPGTAISTAEIAARLRGALTGGAATGITNQSPLCTLLGYLYDVATTTDEGGSGLTVDVFGNATSIASATIKDPGSGYFAGDKVFMQRGLLYGGAVTALSNEGVGSTLNGTLTDLPTISTIVNSEGLTVTVVGDGTKLIAVAIGNNAGIGYRANTATMPSWVDVPRNRLQGGPVSTLSSEGATTTRSVLGTGLATTTNTGGTGLTLNVTGNGQSVSGVTVNTAGVRYHIGSKIYIARNVLDGSGTDTTPVHVATITAVTNADTTRVRIATVKSVEIDDTPVLLGTISAAAAGPLTGVTIARSGSVLHLTSASTITISATDARANADITAITGSVQSFTSLPAIAPQGYQVEVAGDPTNNFDGYYLKFVPRTGAGTFGEGEWQETVAPGAQYKLNPSTMPQVLVRLPAGTWYFGPLNGAALTGLTLPTWGERTAGDSESAPDPSFVGQTVNDVFVHRGRLGILADEKRILSRAKDFFAFFPETVTTVLDSDPIDKTASSSRVSVLRYAVPFQGEMLLFSDDYQFRSYATDASLTPTTDVITILTSYEIDPGARPIQMGGSVVFCQANGEWSQLRQFSVRGAGTALVGDAESITEHVSSYIPSGIFQLAANDTGNSLYCISSKTGYKNRIYTYKYFYRNTGSGIERAQSSWSYWDLPGADSILSIVAIQEALYLLVQRGVEVFLEKLPVLDRQSVAAAPYPLLLDRWVSTTTASPAAMRVPAGVYSPVTKLTTWTLPFTIRAATQAWSAYQAGYQGGVLLGTASSGNTIAARGDWSAAQVYFGEAYTFRYRPSRFKPMRAQGGGQVASNTLRAQIRQARLRYHETGYFQVRVKPSGNRDEGLYYFPGSTVGLLQGVDQGQAGVFPIPIFGRGESNTITIENDTAHPCKFASLEWTGLITGKGRAVQ